MHQQWIGKLPRNILYFCMLRNETWHDWKLIHIEHLHVKWKLFEIYWICQINHGTHHVDWLNLLRSKRLFRTCCLVLILKKLWIFSAYKQFYQLNSQTNILKTYCHSRIFSVPPTSNIHKKCNSIPKILIVFIFMSPQLIPFSSLKQMHETSHCGSQNFMQFLKPNKICGWEQVTFMTTFAVKLQLPSPCVE